MNQHESMPANYQVVRYRPEFKRQVIELQVHLWSSNLALNESYFEWKHERNPYQNQPTIYLATYGDTVVGMRSFFVVRWEAGIPAQEFPGLYADDAVIAPEHRNRGLMPRIMRTALEDLAARNQEYVFNLSAGPMTFLTSLAMGWKSAGSFQPMHTRTWPTTIRNWLHLALRLAPFALKLRKRFLARAPRRAVPTLANVRRHRVEKSLRRLPKVSFGMSPRCQAMAELIQRIPTSGRIRHVRTAEFFDWRFQNPLSRYRFLFWDDPRLEGYLVLHEYTSDRANRGLLNITDWEASDASIKAALLQAAIKIAGQRRLNVWSAALDHETLSLLRSCGFKRPRTANGVKSQCPAILVKGLKNPNHRDWKLADIPLMDKTSWDLRMLYSMAG